MAILSGNQGHIQPPERAVVYRLGLKHKMFGGKKRKKKKKALLWHPISCYFNAQYQNCIPVHASPCLQPPPCSGLHTTPGQPHARTKFKTQTQRTANSASPKKPVAVVTLSSANTDGEETQPNLTMSFMQEHGFCSSGELSPAQDTASLHTAQKRQRRKSQPRKTELSIPVCEHFH